MSGPRIHGRYVVRITPADVGSRVSIRSRVGQDEDGPRFTDVLGHLESWADGVLVVRRRDDSTVELREAAIVAGKVLPPPPPRRAPRRHP